MLTHKEKDGTQKVFSVISLIGGIVMEVLFALMAIAALVAYPLGAYPPSHTVAQLLDFDRGLALGLFGFAVFVGYLAHIVMSSILDLQGWIADRMHKSDPGEKAD